MKNSQLIHIDTIYIENLIPNVFSGVENDMVISCSEVWNKKLVLERGKNYLLHAESGKGKSSLISFIYGRRNDYTGLISFNQIDIKKLTIADWCKIRRTSMAWLPQEMCLFDELTARQNVQLKNNLTSFRTEEWIEKAFELFEIDNRIDVPVKQLSIGQQQRVAIIRTLCQPMDFLLLDEPVSHLDERNNNIIASFLTECANKSGAGILCTSVGNTLNLNYNKEIML